MLVSKLHPGLFGTQKTIHHLGYKWRKHLQSSPAWTVHRGGRILPTPYPSAGFFSR